MAPTLGKQGLEISIHRCPKLLIRELCHIFPTHHANLIDDPSSYLVIATCQEARHDLTKIGPEIEREKDRLLENFSDWAAALCHELDARGYFADYIDPCSGLPMRTPNTTRVYSEVDGMELLLHYRCLNAGMCKVLLHPKYGAAVYPATLFTNAPLELLHQGFANQHTF